MTAYDEPSAQKALGYEKPKRHRNHMSKWSPTFLRHVGFCNVTYCSAVLQSPNTPECGILGNSCFHVKLHTDACSTPVYINTRKIKQMKISQTRCALRGVNGFLG